MPYPSVAQGDLTVSIISSLYNRAKAASKLAADSKKEAFKRFKSVGLTDKQAKDAVDTYNFGKESFKSRFGGDRYRRTRGFFGSERPQDDITVNERERVLRGMGIFTKKRKTGDSAESPGASGDSYSGGSSGGGPKGGGPTISPLAGLLPPAKANLDDALKGVRPDGEYMSKEERIAAFRANKVSSTSSGDLTERAIFGKKQTLEEAVVKLAEEVKENRELLLEVEDNTSFIEKLFNLQKDAIEDAKAEKEKSDIAAMRDSAGFSEVEKLKEGGFGDLLGGFGDFAGNLLDLVGGRTGKRGARRRLAGRKFGNLKKAITGKGGPTRSPIGQRPGRGQFVNGRFYRGKVSQFAPKQKNVIQKTLQRGRIASGKMGQQLLRRGGAKAATGIAGKAVGKSLLKKVPLLGLGVSALFAAQRAMAGDIVGAGMELASGAASTVPGLGTAASVGIDAALMAKDMQGGEGYERGGVVDGPDTGYPVTLHGTEAIIPLDNKFTRGEPTVTKGGDYEKGNLTISRDYQPRSMKEKNETKKELGEAFKYGLELYEKKSSKGLFGILGDKIKEWLGNDDDEKNPPPGPGGGGGGGTPQLSGGVAPAGVEVGKSKLQMDIESFRTARKQEFGVSDERVATDNTFNLAIRELRGAAGGSSINELADDLSYQDIHRSEAHKHGYGFDVPVGNPAQAKFVIDFFRSRGYQTIHGADDPSGKHDTHVHVQAPDEKAADFLKIKGADVKPFDPNKSYVAGDRAIKNGKEMKFDGMGWGSLDGPSAQDLGDQAQLVPPEQSQAQKAQQVQLASLEAENAKRQAIIAMASLPSNTQQPTVVSPPPRQSLTETGGKASNTAFDGLGAFVNMNQMAMTA